MCKELDNIHDRQAVCVMKDGAIVGHVPRELSRTMDVLKGWCRDMYCHRETQKRDGFRSTLCLLFGSQEKTYDESAAILTCAQNVVSIILSL